MTTDVVGRLWHGPHGSSSQAMDLPRRPLWATNAEIGHEHVVALVLWLQLGSVVVISGWWTAGSWLAAVGSLALVLSPAIFVFARRGRRQRRVVAQLPDTVDRLSRSLRSGSTLRSALIEVAHESPVTIAQELQPIVDSVTRGMNLTTALQVWAERIPRPEVRTVAAAVAVADQHQVGAAQSLDRVGQSLRDRAALAGEIASLTAQASASMRTMVLLPLAFLALDAASDQQLMRYLVQEPLGQLCLGVGLGLDVIGWLWMRVLVNRRMPQ